MAVQTLDPYGAHGSTEQAFDAHNEGEVPRDKGSRTKKEVDSAGIGPRRNNARQASAQQTRNIGLLRPGRA